MNIILTHEQADFDAIAGLLGVYLVQDSAIPILPRKLNRNVHAFLSLYGSEFPFVDTSDLPDDQINHVTLVDTQSLVTLKGFSKKTRVQVIGHHLQRENLDPEWSYQSGKVGAVTTLLVEAIRERSIPLTRHQATLFILGIYEDTGSMTYASTTARDIHAAAYLLEQGADLGKAINYLNPPLSEQQRRVYDRLLENAQIHNIHDLRMIISTADARGLQEEVSSIAHKMRDLLESDGLCIIVATDEGYRIVFRSTCDQLNVSLLAAHFGGGGHERAAAALVHRPSGLDPELDAQRLDEIREELLQLLPAYIHPPVTVRQIMSRRPRLITPQTTASEALSLMQKYGYEGFPVIANGQVKGLLTRRAVDRSLAHKLDLAASSLMEAGSINVLSTDSVDHLQDVMTETGWGQIPVLNPETHEIVGIVTRTDLLKNLARSHPRQHVYPFAARLDKALPPSQLGLLKCITEQAASMNMAVYIVGGFVRDLILDRPNADFDIVTEGDAINLAHKLVGKYGGRIICHTRFGTAKWFPDPADERLISILPVIKGMTKQALLPESLDLITARTEFYEHPTALPTVERSSIKLDLHRRDFTINTMAIRLDGHHYGELLDYYGGYHDLKKGSIRVLHSLSFIDDPTRAIRAVRFEQRFGFTLEERTRQLMLEAAGQLKSITGERVRHEFDLMFIEDQPAMILNRLSEMHLLENIHPALTWDQARSGNLSQLMADNASTGWGLPEKLWGRPLRLILGYSFWLMDRPDDQIQVICRRLRIPGNIASVIRQAHRLSKKIEGMIGCSPSVIYHRLNTVNEAAIRCVYFNDISPEARQLLEKYIQNWSRVEPTIDGRDLLKMGVPAGPHYKSILTDLKSAWLDGIITNPSEETSKLKELIHKHVANH